MPASLKNVPLLELRTRLRESFWFIPLLMLGGALGLATITLWADWSFEDAIGQVGLLAWIRLGGASGARGLLTAVAGSVMTVVGVIFSVTIAVLALTSSQFGPRLLGAFVRDQRNHVALGTFLGTFLFCLVITLTIGDGDDPVPRLSVLTGAALAVVSLLTLVFFIHHVAQFVQADTIVARAAQELDDVIEALYGLRGQHPEEAAQELPESFAARSTTVDARAAGYVTAVDLDHLTAVACERDLIVDLCSAPGAFVAPGDPLLRVGPTERVDDEAKDALRRRIYIDHARTSEQDVRFAISQLVEIALRAMSTGLNDPHTATRCVDRLEAGLRRLCRRVPPPAARRDEGGRLRLVARWPGLEDTIGGAFDPLRVVAGQTPLLLGRLVDAIAAIAPDAPDGQAVSALRRQVEGLRGCTQQFDEVSRREARLWLARATGALDAAAARVEGPVAAGARA